MAERLDKSEGCNEWNKHAVENPEEVASMVDMSIRNSTKMRNMGYFSCGIGNPIDDYWHYDTHWHLHRKRLVDYGIGFGRNVIGG